MSKKSKVMLGGYKAHGIVADLIIAAIILSIFGAGVVAGAYHW